MAIANSIGYTSESAFISAFRRSFGLTPGSYRATINGRQGVPDVRICDQRNA
jgi:AraC-like DNA-binding protein